MGKAKRILKHTAKRVFPLPNRKWKYYQQWHDTLFFHWKVPPALLEDYIPRGTTLDTINNMAWVSLVAFEVKKMRMRNLPPFPYINNFHEINVRTYIIKDGIPGIYIFSIETDKFIEVLLTRLFVGLPYQKATIKRNRFSLFSHNSNGQGADITYTYLVTPIKKTKTDLWLTERHALYQPHGDKLYRFDIHHPEWRLKKLLAALHYIDYRVGRFSLNMTPDKIHYCKKLPVLLWTKEAV